MNAASSAKQNGGGDANGAHQPRLRYIHRLITNQIEQMYKCTNVQMYFFSDWRWGRRLGPESRQ